jgi:hypothetical protein
MLESALLRLSPPGTPPGLTTWGRAAGRFAPPAVGSLLEAPSGLMGVRCFFWTQKNLIPGKGRGYTRVTTLILFITNHIQYKLGMLCHQQRLCPASLQQGADITFGSRFRLHTATNSPLQRHFSGEIFGYNSSIGLHQTPTL